MTPTQALNAAIRAAHKRKIKTTVYNQTAYLWLRGRGHLALRYRKDADIRRNPIPGDFVREEGETDIARVIRVTTTHVTVKMYGNEFVSTRADMFRLAGTLHEKHGEPRRLLRR